MVGGIAGNNAGKIMNSTNKTSVNAGTNVGGITGQNTATGQVMVQVIQIVLRIS